MELLRAGAESLGIRLGPSQLGQFRRYFDELVDWNSRINLTSVTGWEEVQTRHFLDSLTISLAVPPEVLRSGCFIDVGSGAGFPGVPLKIAYPGLRATLIDSTSKKTAFLATLKDLLELPDLEVRTGRAEALARETGLRESFDFAVVRAVASVSVLAELALPFCRIGGFAVLQKRLGIAPEVERAQCAILATGGRLRELKEVRVDGVPEATGLVVIEKVSPTPQRYPRRPGIPAKRPL